MPGGGSDRQARTATSRFALRRSPGLRYLYRRRGQRRWGEAAKRSSWKRQIAARKSVRRSPCRLATAISSFRPRRATRENGVGIPCLQEWCLSCREYREGVVNEYLRAKAGACGYEIVPDAIALAGRSGGRAKPRAAPSCHPP